MEKQKQSATLYTVMQFFGVSRPTLLKWMDEGRFPGAYKDGDLDSSPWMIPVEDVENARRERVHELQGRINELQEEIDEISISVLEGAPNGQ